MKKWVICNKVGEDKEIEKRFGLNPVTVRMLINRGIDTVEKAENYLFPHIEDMHDPRLLADSEKAADILYRALKSGKKIRVIGDYDVDGVSSTFVLFDCLKKLSVILFDGADNSASRISYRIPDRIKDGYGMNNTMVDECKSAGIDLIITCDNGISAYDQVEYANESGIGVIVTDHHEVPELLPNALAVVDPKRKDCNYPFGSICGAVVAAKVLEVLVHHFCTENERKKLLGNCSTVVEKYIVNLAMATVCDVCPLEDENRAIVKFGINKLRETDNPGLNALLEICVKDKQSISAYHLGYVIGPCFNATGRLAVADLALKLLDAEDEAEAKALAVECHSLNEERKELTRQWLDRAQEMVEEEGLLKDKVLVVFLDGCHESLAGIIAGRLREKYSRPSFVITRAEGALKGSGRSIEAYNMFEEISKASEHLIRFGGHPMAAGLSLSEDELGNFRDALNANTTLTDADLVEKVVIDAVVPFGLINEKLISELELLEPFGTGNDKPVFAEKNLQVLNARKIGKTTDYFKFSLKNSYERQFDALYFGNYTDLYDEMIARYGKKEVDDMFRGRTNNVRLTVTYYPQLNEYMGSTSVQMIISDIRLE